MTALVLAAHGAGDGSPANRAVEALAREVARRTSFAPVAAAFRLGTPAFSEVLDGLPADRAVVVPLLTGPGWYADVVLPRELARNRRFHRLAPRIAPPVGTHPSAPAAVLDLALAAAARTGLAPGGTALVVVGHGSDRHPSSGAGAAGIAARLREASPFAEVLPAYLDQEPSVEAAVAAAAASAVLVVPFLLGGGRHAEDDVLRRARSAPDRAGKPVAAAEPFGRSPRLADLVIAIAGSPAAPAGDREEVVA